MGCDGVTRTPVSLPSSHILSVLTHCGDCCDCCDGVGVVVALVVEREHGSSNMQHSSVMESSDVGPVWTVISLELAKFKKLLKIFPILKGVKFTLVKTLIYLFFPL